MKQIGNDTATEWCFVDMTKSKALDALGENRAAVELI
jgi:hypothetical protein